MRLRRITMTMAGAFIAAATALAGVGGASAAEPTGRAPVSESAAQASAGQLDAASVGSPASVQAATAEENIGSRLNPGESMNGATQYLESPSGQFQVAADGDAGDDWGLYWASWSSFPQAISENTAAGASHVLVMQGDGNLVLYTNGPNPTFNSGTQGNPGAFMVLQNDGNLVVYSAAGKPLWWSGTFAHDMFGLATPDDNYSSFLYGGWAITSPQGKYRLVMQGDGNLVLYSTATGRAIWHTGTHGNPGAFAAFQNDGNLVVYSASGTPLWSSGKTRATGVFSLLPQDDGNMVVYWISVDTGRTSALWATGTQGRR